MAEFLALKRRHDPAEGRPVDARSDIFSFGAVLYEMLSGRRPFGGSTRVGVITAILRDQPPPIRTVRADAPLTIDRILQRALAKEPAGRYGTHPTTGRPFVCRTRRKTVE